MVTLIVDVDPLLEPSNGPTRFPFDPELLYTIKIDNDHDAIEDVSFDFYFKNDFRLSNVFVGLVRADAGLLQKIHWHRFRLAHRLSLLPLPHWMALDLKVLISDSTINSP